jgi:glucoselysine-6-phosphate deglycase
MPATRTHVTALFRMIFLATRLAGAGADGGNTLRRQDFDALPEQVAALMAGCQSRAAEIVDKMRDCPTLITVGYGPNSATAAEAAMAFNQSAGIPSQSYELDNFIHGPIQALKPGMGVFVIAAPGPMVDKSLALAHACKILGATVVVLSAQGDRASDDHADAYIAMPQGVPDLLSSVAYMVPFWQIAYEFGSLGKGCQPDRLSMDKPEFKTALGYLMHQDKWVTQ